MRFTFVIDDEGISIVALHVGEGVIHVSVVRLICHLQKKYGSD